MYKITCVSLVAHTRSRTHARTHRHDKNKIHPGVFKNENVHRTSFIIIT